MKNDAARRRCLRRGALGAAARRHGRVPHPGAASGRGRSGRSVALRVSPTRRQRFPLAAERCSGGNAAIGLRALKLKDPLHPELWICRGLIWVLEMVTKFTSVMSLTGAEPARRPVADARVLDGPVARTALPRSLFFGREWRRMRR